MAKPASAASREAWGYLHSLFFSEVVHRQMHDACNSLGINPPVMKALLTFDASEARPMRDLAASWRCDASWVTSLVDVLEERGFAERQPSPTDRRVKMVMLTPEGVKAKAEMLELMHEPPEALGTLSAAEQRSVRDALRLVVDALEASSPPEIGSENDI